MIRLLDPGLPASIHDDLASLQSQIDGIPDYQTRVAVAKDLFKARNTSHNRVFFIIRSVLTQMCSGAKRCCYCEDSAADEVEHIKPKALYPESVFQWDNYLYACGLCNGPKNSDFAVFHHLSGVLTNVARRPNQAINPPEPGSPVLINPRYEDPLEFIELDLINTFLFLPKYDIDTRGKERAAYTIKVLNLNRDYLIKARNDAYDTYRARLLEYITERENGASAIHLAYLVQSLLNISHPTVWHEIKRRQRQIPEFMRLFDSCPEALNW